MVDKIRKFLSKHHSIAIALSFGLVIGIFIEEIIGGILILLGMLQVSELFTPLGILIFLLGLATTIVFRKQLINNLKKIFL